MLGVRPLRPGDPESVGDYPVTGFLGEGGQGSVYLGLSPSGERVAIKLLHARFADDEQAVRRFRREAEAARRVAEFCTARVLEVGAVDDRPFIVGEYVDGPSLQHQVTTEGPMRGQVLVRLAIATATALAAIHRAGVVHRDFKPSNVLLGPDGPRVIDFGIARALDVSQSLTTSVVGTPAYMAPEQFHGRPEPASDVFAWAGTMVFAATGRSAFGFGTLPMVMHRILSATPDLSGVPEPLAALLWAALGKDPRLRPTAEQVLGELIRSNAPAGTTTPPPPSGPPVPGLPAPGAHHQAPPAHVGPPSQAHQTPPAHVGPRSQAAPGPGGSGSRRRVLVPAVAVATALVIGVVTWLVSRGDTPAGSGQPGTATGRATGQDAAVAAIANPSNRTGGTVRVASGSALDSTDPGDAYFPDTLNLIRLYGRSLTMFKPAPGAAGTQIVPDLAERLGQPSDAGKTWTYTLRRGAKYDDGAPITSADVKYAVLRSMDEGFANGSAHFDELLALPTGYQGPYRSPSADTDSAIETPDDRTIVFHLKEPYGAFDQVVQLPETVPVPRGRDTRDKYRFAVASSGPYMFESATEQRLVLVRNEQWDPATDPNRTRLPDRFEMDFGQDAAEAARKLSAGEVTFGPPVTQEQEAEISASSALRSRSDTPLTGGVNYLAINPQVEPFDDPGCRRAVIQALGLAAVPQGFRTGLGAGQVPTSLVPPSIPGTHAPIPGLTANGDPDAARRSLAACGEPGGFETTYIYRDVPGEAAAAQAVRTALGRAGIRVTPRGHQVAEFHQRYGGNPAYLKKEGIGLIAKTWAPDWPDTGSFLSLLADSRQITKEYSINVSVRVPAIDSLVDQATRELDGTERAALWARAEQRIAEEAVLVPLVWRRTLLLRGRDATNVHVSPVYGNYDLVTMGVA
ncbi:ABC transporter substrate-binding protein [Nonomuraea cavernae]|uniref:ABC transporter substrate-binding protein n=1 Tax=Nonomuraea cavernae TaxID=2045107 RepID=UPI0033CDC258